MLENVNIFSGMFTQLSMLSLVNEAYFCLVLIFQEKLQMNISIPKRFVSPIQFIA